jgi:hypothetical protein
MATGPALAQIVAPAPGGAAAPSAPNLAPPSAQVSGPPLTVPPAVPDPEHLKTLPAIDLARGYLAAENALPLASQAAQGQGVLGLGIDGIAYTVNASNAPQFITFLQARAAAFTKAIMARGSTAIDGQYTVSAGPGCVGEKYDPRQIFASSKGPNGVQLASGIQIVTSGIDTNMLVTLAQNRQTIGSLISGTAVENTVVFADVLSMGYSLYGSVSANTITLRLDPDEVKNALGASAGTDADWKRLEACVFTLTRK